MVRKQTEKGARWSYIQYTPQSGSWPVAEWTASWPSGTCRRRPRTSSAPGRYSASRTRPYDRHRRCTTPSNVRITRSMYWRRASQAPGDATVRKRFFRGNFFIFRRRSKRIAFLESMNFSTCAYMQLFNFRDVTWPLLGTLQVSISAKCLVTDSPESRLAKGTPSESRLSIGTIGLG